MAMASYMKPEGQKQGWIKGSVTQKVGGVDFKDWIAVIAVSHSILSPRDIQSGLPTGQRMHKPFVVTKELDKATPLLYGALCTNENLKTVEVKFHTPQLRATSGIGAEVNHFTIKLTNANIASIDFRMANIRHADLQKFNEYEELALTYQKIEWTWNDGGITAGDDWEIRS
jgi:type VI secretion system secreted protein Hcp